MQVKELLIESLCRANHIQRGYPAEASEISSAMNHFNSQLRKYGDMNLITAYQRVLDFIPTGTNTVIGRPTECKGIRFHVVDKMSDLVSLSGYNPITNNKGIIIDKDYFFVESNPKSGDLYCLYTVTGSGSTYVWTPITTFGGILKNIPDVWCMNMQKIMAAMVKNSFGTYDKLDCVPLTRFYLDGRKNIYCSNNAGENKVNVILTEGRVNCNIRLIYNCGMKFDKNDYLELPEAHIELLTLAVTCAILREDVDSDPTALANYKNELSELEAQITSQTSSTRMITRDPDSYHHGRLEALYTGSFLRR